MKAYITGISRMRLCHIGQRKHILTDAIQCRDYVLPAKIRCQNNLASISDLFRSQNRYCTLHINNLVESVIQYVEWCISIIFLSEFHRLSRYRIDLNNSPFSGDMKQAPFLYLNFYIWKFKSDNFYLDSSIKKQFLNR